MGEVGHYILLEETFHTVHDFVVKNVFLRDDTIMDFFGDLSLFYNGKAAHQADLSECLEGGCESKEGEIDSLSLNKLNKGSETGTLEASFADEAELMTQMAALGLPNSFGTSSKIRGSQQLKKPKNSNRKMKKVSNAFKNKGQVEQLLLQQEKATEGQGCLELRFVPTSSSLLPSVEGQLESSSSSEEVSKTFSSSKFLEKAQVSRKEACDRNNGADAAGCIHDAASFQDHDKTHSLEGGGFLIQEAVTFPWVPIWDSHYNRYYFYNYESLETTWETPRGLELYSCAWKQNKDETGQEVCGALGCQVEEAENEVSNVNKTDGFSEVSVDDQENTWNQITMGASIESECRFNSSTARFESNIQCEDKYSTLVYENRGKEHWDHISLEAEMNRSNLKTQDGMDEATIPPDPCNDEVRQHECGKVLGFRRHRKKKQMKLMKRADIRETGPGKVYSTSIEKELTANVFKYWVQRYRLFSKFDEGVQLDEEGWFSVTPEVIAKHQAARCGQGLIIDAFVGVGGNAIQFALMNCHVIGIDIDPKKVGYAKHNANIYGVTNLIDFVIGDFFSLSHAFKADVVFLSPPWGGPEYMNVDNYDIQTMMQPKDGLTLLKIAQTLAQKIVFFLPRNTDVGQLAQLSSALSPHLACEVEKNFVNGKLKAITAYFGEFGSLE